jgi:hypothetical protein
MASVMAGCIGPTGMPAYYGTVDTTYSDQYATTSVSFGYFYDELAPHGRWFRHPRWGDVWHPTRVEQDFRPYHSGHWVNTVEFGWTWYSDYPWNDAPFHYGRWVFDPYEGWLWVPGYVWSPAWVIWRSGGGHVGWFPMPPDDRFLGGYDAYRTDWDWNRGFGYRDWYGPSFSLEPLLAAWVFIEIARLGDRDYYTYARPRTQHVTIINNTTNVTNYVTINNRIVNRSVDVTQVERARGRPIERVVAREVVRAPVTTIDRGRQIENRERRDHSGNLRASARERARPLTADEARPRVAPPDNRRVAPEPDRTIGPRGDQGVRPRAVEPARTPAPARAERIEVTPAEPSEASPRTIRPDREQRAGRVETAEPADSRVDRERSDRRERAQREDAAVEVGPQGDGLQTEIRRGRRAEDVEEADGENREDERERARAARAREN